MSNLEIVQRGVYRIELERDGDYWGASVWLGDEEINPSGLMVRDREAALEDAMIAVDDREDELAENEKDA